MAIRGQARLPYADKDWFKDRRDRAAEHPLSEAQTEFIEWLVNPERPGTQVQWARDHGFADRTPADWKKQTMFRREWERRATELNGGVERTQNVVNALYRQAAEGDVKAAQLYLQYVDKFTPTRKVITEDRGVQEMSDEELADTLEAQVVQLRQRKGA